LGPNRTGSGAGALTKLPRNVSKNWDYLIVLVAGMVMLSNAHRHVMMTLLRVLHRDVCGVRDFFLLFRPELFNNVWPGGL